ncbi:MAG: hypothetical protein RIR43_1605, partial [Pseudomonadota bacterium]
MGNERRFLGFAAAMAAAVMLSACAGPGQVVKLR